MNVPNIEQNIQKKQGSHKNRRWWPSGLSHHVSNSSRDRRLGPRFNTPRDYNIDHPKWKTFLAFKQQDALPTEYDIDRPESEMTCHYSNSRVPGSLRLLTISTRLRHFLNCSSLCVSYITCFQCQPKFNKPNILLLYILYNTTTYISTYFSVCFVCVNLKLILLIQLTGAF